MIASVRSTRCRSPLPRQFPMGERMPTPLAQRAPQERIECFALTVAEPPETASAASACAWPTATTDVTRSVPIHRKGAIASVLIFGLGGPFPVHAALEDFTGRHQTISSDCRFMPTTGKQRTCRVVQIDGRTATILSLRFVGEGERTGSSQRLTFVVSALSNTPLLNCNLGRCQLGADNWEGKINSVSEANYDADGLAESVPKSWAVKQGNCSVQAGQISCSADVPGGGQISAKAEL